MKVFIGENFSCGVNYQYLELIYKLKRTDSIIIDDPSDADVIIFSDTCACHSDRILLVLQYIESVLKRKKEGAKVYLTGCLAREFIDKKRFKEVNDWLNENIDLIVPGNRVDLILKDMYKDIFENYRSKSGFNIVLGDEALLFISSGCLHKCSFCKTNYQNIPLTSMDLGEVIYFIDMIDKAGVKTLDIRGMNICQFGLDTKGDYLLPYIIDYVEKKENIESVKLVGFAFNDAIHHDFKDTLRNSRKVDFIVGSLESGDDDTLKIMHKGHTASEFIDFNRYISLDHKKMLDTNIIAGYPTETMSKVKKTIEVLKTLKPYLDCVHVCKYVDSVFVPSHFEEQLDDELIKERARIYTKSLQHLGIKTTII